MTTRDTVNRTVTERLRQEIEAALRQRGITAAEAAREAGLPSSVFQSLLRRGKRPTIDRADELCKAVGISMTIGSAEPAAGARGRVTHQGQVEAPPQKQQDDSRSEATAGTTPCHRAPRRNG